MTNNLNQYKNTVPSFAPLIFNVFALLFSLGSLFVLLAGVYHALVYVATYLWNPVIIAVLPAIVFVLMLGVIFLKQPVQNLLCLISIFFSAVILYLYVGAEYLAFLFLIVYVGAIAILFLFVIMLLHIKKSNQPLNLRTFKPFAPLILFVGTVCFGLNDLLSFSVQKNSIDGESLLMTTEPTSLSALKHYVLNQHSDILSFSDILYRFNAVLFFLVALLLLTAMLGAIVLATSATDEVTSGFLIIENPSALQSEFMAVKTAGLPVEKAKVIDFSHKADARSATPPRGFLRSLLRWIAVITSCIFCHFVFNPSVKINSEQFNLSILLPSFLYTSVLFLFITSPLFLVYWRDKQRFRVTVKGRFWYDIFFLFFISLSLYLLMRINMPYYTLQYGSVVDKAGFILSDNIHFLGDINFKFQWSPGRAYEAIMESLHARRWGVPVPSQAFRELNSRIPELVNILEKKGSVACNVKIDEIIEEVKDALRAAALARESAPLSWSEWAQSYLDKIGDSIVRPFRYIKHVIQYNIEMRDLSRHPHDAILPGVIATGGWMY